MIKRYLEKRQRRNRDQTLCPRPLSGCRCATLKKCSAMKLRGGRCLMLTLRTGFTSVCGCQSNHRGFFRHSAKEPVPGFGASDG